MNRTLDGVKYITYNTTKKSITEDIIIGANFESPSITIDGATIPATHPTTSINKIIVYNILWSLKLFHAIF